MYSFFKTLTDTEIFILLPLSACLALFIITLILRRFRFTLFSNHYDADILDTATQNTMSGAYVVLGFVLVLAMTTLSDMDSKISQEATAIRSLERLLILEGTPQSNAARKQLMNYVSSVLNDEWPALKNGQPNEKTAGAMKDFFSSLDNIDPKTAKDVMIYSKILDKADEVAQLRNARMFSVQNNLPSTFYHVSLLSLLGVLIISALRLLEATTMRVIALTTQIAILTVMFSAVVIIDLPYLGDTTISPEAIVLVHESMKTRDAASK